MNLTTCNAVCLYLSFVFVHHVSFSMRISVKPINMVRYHTCNKICCSTPSFRTDQVRSNRNHVKSVYEDLHVPCRILALYLEGPLHLLTEVKQATSFFDDRSLSGLIAS